MGASKAGLIEEIASDVSPRDGVVSENGSSSPLFPVPDSVSSEHVFANPEEPSNTPASEPPSESAAKQSSESNPDFDIPNLTNSDKDGSISDISQKTSDSIPSNGADKPSSLNIKQTTSENGLNSSSDLSPDESGMLSDSTAPRDVLLSSHSGPLANGSVTEISAPEDSRSEIKVPDTSGSKNSDTSSAGLNSSSDTSGSKINDTSSGYANTLVSSREGEASCSLESSQQDASDEALVSSTSAETNMRWVVADSLQTIDNQLHGHADTNSTEILYRTEQNDVGLGVDRQTGSNGQDMQTSSTDSHLFNSTSRPDYESSNEPLNEEVIGILYENEDLDESNPVVCEESVHSNYNEEITLFDEDGSQTDDEMYGGSFNQASSTDLSTDSDLANVMLRMIRDSENAELLSSFFDRSDNRPTNIGAGWMYNTFSVFNFQHM